MLPFRRVLPLVLAACAVAACDDPPPTLIEEPDPTVKTFTGTLTVNGGATHRFITTASGEVKAQLKVLVPDTVPVGLWLGVWTGASCNMIVENQSAVVNTTVVGVTSATGEFCARVFDPGRLTESVSYTIDVSHF